jgi:uncharacterized protein (DUF885 family)
LRDVDFPNGDLVIDQLMDSHVSEHAAIDPLMATALGLPGHDTRLPDLSPEGFAAVSDLRRRTLSSLARLTPATQDQRVTAAAAREQLTVAELLRAEGVEESCLNNTDSPLQTVRSVFDSMPTATTDDWSTIAVRLNRVPQALAGYVASLRYAAEHGRISPRRQILACVEQCREASDYFIALVGQAPFTLSMTAGGVLDHGAHAAARAYEDLAAFLSQELLPKAPHQDAVGRELYALMSRKQLGTAVDPAEAYAWGQRELARVAGLMRETAELIEPGSSVEEAMDLLTLEPARRLHGPQELRAWMQDRSDEAIDTLAGTHFDIPASIRRLECRIAPTSSGGVYYTGPSEDLNRPGRMWWSVPRGVRDFFTWRELSTVHHEGVPGHHLQVAGAIQRSELNRWRRLASWVPGHGEGWALYAERLMAELGHLDDPGDRLGMLDSQSFRAVRVVIDIGFHCGFEAPAEVGGGQWTYEKGWALLTAHSGKPHPRLRQELDRCLGLPADASSYKLGERFWLALREEVRAAEGAAFTLRSFHRRALDLGSVGLDVLRSAVLGGAAG